MFNDLSTLSWPGLSRPPRLLGSEPDDRDRRDKPGDDALYALIQNDRKLL
jgi:hypothetical protein